MTSKDKLPPALRQNAQELKDKSTLGTHKRTPPICVKLPSELDAYVRSLPDRSAWLRQAVHEKWEKDRLS